MDIINKLHILTKGVEWKKQLKPLPASWKSPEGSSHSLPILPDTQIKELPQAVYFCKQNLESWLFPTNPLHPQTSILLIFENQQLIGGLNISGDTNNPIDIAYLIKDITSNSSYWKAYFKKP